MITTMQIADLLDKTATHIERYGWTQNDFLTDRAGVPPTQCPVCLRGAIAAAAGQHPCFGEQPFEHAQILIKVDDVYELGPADEADLDLIRAVEGAFRAHLLALGAVPVTVTDGELEEWNDTKGRTAEQVVTELRACAANLRMLNTRDEVRLRLTKRALQRQATGGGETL